MKMNRFKMNLHLAFLDLDTPSSAVDMAPEARLERELNELKAPVLREFSTATNNFLNEVNQNKEQKILSRYTDSSELRRDQKRFFERINSVNDGKKYSDLWNEKIVQGFGDLISALKENKYFNGKDVQAETAKIKEQYWDEVKNQYIDKVWFSSDKKFNGEEGKNNGLKDILFGRESGKDYPANKIYCKLTGASTIFKVDRTYIEGYGIDILHNGNNTDNNLDNKPDNDEEMSERQKRNFLSWDLPKYLWDIRKTPQILKALSWLPIFKVTEDRPSDEDVKALKDFLKISSKIKVEGNKDKAVALIEALKDNRLNTDSSEDLYKAVLEDHNITVDKGDLDDVVDAGHFYINTQQSSNSELNQHAIYLSVLKIIENEGGVSNAVKNLKPVVEQAKADKKTEKKEGYETGENLPEDILNLAKKLGITDFTNVARLNAKEDGYFKENSAEDILANLNNDLLVNAADVIVGGAKTGQQFKEIFGQLSNEIGRDKVLKNLFDRAKSSNKVLALGLDESEFTEDQIKKGNKKLIILLQSIISSPKEDLYTLLLGAERQNKGPLEGEDLHELEKEGKYREDAFNEAGNILNEKAFLEDYKALLEGNNDVDIQNFADLQASLASCLYDNYKLGLGVGSTLSFKDWAKGLQIGTGAQVRGDGVVLGLSVSYNKSFDLGRNWTLTPGLSAGVFLPIVSGKKDVFASVGLNLTIDKNQVNLSTGTGRHYGFDAGFNVLTDTAYLGRHDSWNKAENIPEAAKFQSQKFEQLIMRDVLNKIKDKIRNQKMDLNNDDILNTVRDVILKVVESQPDISESDRENVVNGMLDSLIPYSNENLTQEGVKYAIAKKVAEQYGHTWSEKRKAEIIEGGTYYAGYSVGAFWVVGTPVVGVYSTHDFIKHDRAGRGDVYGRERELNQEYQREWNQDELDKKLNKELGLTQVNGIKLESGFVVIPKSLTHIVNITEENMRGLMKKDEKGNIYLDTYTPISINVRTGGNTQSKEIMIGGKKGKINVKLDTLGDDWFTKGNIDRNKVIELSDTIEAYTAEIVNKALQNVKDHSPQGDKIRNYNFENMDELLKQLNAIDKSKVARISIVEEDGELKRKVEQGNGGRGLEIKYQARFDMIDPKAKVIANKIYERASSKNINLKELYKVKHPKLSAKYEEFLNNMSKNEYEKAKENIISILNVVCGEDFVKTLDWPDSQDALVQSLYSINNVFARSMKVRGLGQENDNGKKISKYSFTKEMGSIIGEREGQIGKTIENSNIPDTYKTAYIELINASKKYRTSNIHKQEFRVQNAMAAQLDNAVGFNLGDKRNPENPLFNPEIYQQMIDLRDLENYGFSKEQRGVLFEREMRLFAGNQALIAPVLKALGITGNPTNIKRLGELDYVDERGEDSKDVVGQLELDIGGKKITLSAHMNFGYFTQCVNHTVVLSDISAVTDDGTSVTFNSGVWNGKKYTEGTDSTIVATTKYGFGLSVTSGNEGGQNEESYTETGKEDRGKNDRTDIPGATDITDPHNTGNGQNGGGDIPLGW